MAPGMIKLQSAVDGRIFNVAFKVVSCSTTIRDVMAKFGVTQETGCDIPMPLPRIDGATLEKVLKWADHHKDDVSTQAQGLITSWDEEFLKMDEDMLKEVTLAAHKLNIPALVEMCCKTHARLWWEASRLTSGPNFEQLGMTLEELEDCFKQGLLLANIIEQHVHSSK